LESKKTASLATATHKLIIAARATQAFQQASLLEPEGESSSNVLQAEHQAVVPGVISGKSSRSLDARPVREPSRSRLDVTAAISTRRLNVPQTHVVSAATGNRPGLMHLTQASPSQRSFSS